MTYTDTEPQNLSKLIDLVLQLKVEQNFFVILVIDLLEHAKEKKNILKKLKRKKELTLYEFDLKPRSKKIDLNFQEKEQ
jgi:hypothetical protein